MNVAFDPWIPVVTAMGERKLLSLHDALVCGEQIADLAVRPHERVALMRLFICVAHAALDGPKDYQEWLDIPRKLSASVEDYLTAWKDSFELFHPEKPWLQIAALAPSKLKDKDSYTPILRLDFPKVNGLNKMLYDQKSLETFPIRLTDAQLALGLLTLQCFSTCGTLSRPLWNGIPTEKSAKDAPCISSSMYHVFLIGENLFGAVCLNVCHFEELSMLYGVYGPDWQGQPVWEKMPADCKDARSTTTYMGRLVPLSRAILLDPNGQIMLYGEGLRYPSFPDFCQEFNTSVITRRNNTERTLVGANMVVHTWRQLPSILQYHLPQADSFHAINLLHENNQALDVWVGALVRKPGQQDILGTVESRFHLPKQLKQKDGCMAYSVEVKKAEEIAKLLGKAIYIYRIENDPRNESGLGENAIIYYWTGVEQNIQLLLLYIESIDTEHVLTAREAWRKMLFSKACEAYRIACGQNTPRQMRAFAKGWLRLTSSKKETDINSPELMEVEA